MEDVLSPADTATVIGRREPISMTALLSIDRVLSVISPSIKPPDCDRV